MSHTDYLVTTLALYFGQIIGAITVDDIGLIFEFISAISVSCLAFIFPGLFYLMAEKKFATEQQKDENTYMRYESWAFVVLGLCAFIF